MSMDFYDAYHFLRKHPMFHGRFWEALDIDVVKVNPDTNAIDDDKSKNTKTDVWIETGAYVADQDSLPTGFSPFYHDLYLDCGGATFEDAIIRLAELVLKYYGTDSIHSIMEDEGVSQIVWIRHYSEE